MAREEGEEKQDRPWARVHGIISGQCHSWRALLNVVSFFVV